MSFYRIYRPQTIEEIDNIAVRERLLMLLSKDKKFLPHAFLFTGPKGAGKTTAARIIAKLFNCEHPKKTGPCGTCSQCVSIADGRSIDTIEMDAASNRGIDDVRLLRDGIHLAPVSSPYKVYIIDEVHMLTTEAFNALLKTLEEPPDHAVFVLATTELGKVPATIQSRCTLIPFSKASIVEILEALKRIVTKEHIPIDDAALSYIATYADGAFRDAVKTLEQVSFTSPKGTKKISVDEVSHMLTISDETHVHDSIEALLQRDGAKSFAIVKEVISGGKDCKQFVGDMLSLIQKKLVDGIGKGHGESMADLRELSHALIDAYARMKSSPIEELPLEIAIIEFCEDPHVSARTTAVNSGMARPSDHPNVVTRADDGGKYADRVPMTVPKKVAETQTPGIHEDVVVGKKEEIAKDTDAHDASDISDFLTTEKLKEHWVDIILEAKPFNHSVAGMLRSARPKGVTGNVVTIEAFYPFHQERLSQIQVRDMLSTVLKKLFGVQTKVEIVLGKK